MYIALLGRQPALGMAELERLYGEEATSWFSDVSAKIAIDDGFSIEKLGGVQKAGQVVIELPSGDWRRVSMKIVQAYTHAWSGFEGKITLGISAYGFDVSPREIQQTGIILKQKLKKANVSLRMIPNSDTALNTATSHHNKLGLSNNKVELLVVRARNGRVIIAESTGAQNITAYTKRDQERPKRDAFVGMLPPKLAQIMINLADPTPHSRVLDPFCGTGVVLQEAALLGHSVYGTDLSEKMIRYSKENLDWLKETHRTTFEYDLHEGDAMDTSWQGPIDAVVGETYLGQPFSAPPSPAKLDQVRGNCNNIISAFLKNLGSQLPSGTSVSIAIPAWKRIDGGFVHLPLINQLDQLGFTRHSFKNIKDQELLYFREDQVVARELLVLVKA
ncbi:MAG: methyltransferase domain-containing protein [Candidatus Saccharimonadales bacterium]